jgi:hypothetical protein
MPLMLSRVNSMAVNPAFYHARVGAAKTLQLNPYHCLQKDDHQQNHQGIG